MAIGQRSKGKKQPSSLSDVLGVDMGASALKVVRIRNAREGRILTHAELLPAVAPGEHPSLPKSLKAHYLGLALSGRDAAVRYVTLPGAYEEGAALLKQVREHMGIGE